MSRVEVNEELKKKQKRRQGVIGCLTVLVVVVLFAVVCTVITGPSPASSPLEVYNRVEIGMDLGQVYDLVDPDYGNEACYLVNCEHITTEPLMRYTPTHDVFTDYFIWMFMPRFAKAQPTAVCFYYDVSTEVSTVIAVARLDYDETEDVINTYGSRVLW